MEAEALNCPNCGGAVSSYRTQCEFCKTRLKTMACPSCFGLMFVGTQFCGHCGAKAVQTTIGEAGDLGDCPRCRLRLELLHIGETSLRECGRCDGLWADVDTFEAVCADREKQAAVLGFIGKKELSAEPLAKISYVPCPDCRQLMNRSNFAHSSGVIIDICKQHGVWFDAEELPKIIEFIQNGGMKMAREREMTELHDERARLRDERRRAGILDEGFGVGDLWDDNEQRGIRSFVRALFD